MEFKVSGTPLRVSLTVTSSISYSLTKTLRIMKIAAFLLVALSVHVSAKTLSQTISISVKGAELKMIFSVIEKQTGFHVFYNKGILKEAKLVSVEVDKMPLEDFLKVVLTEQKLEYHIENNNVLVKKSPAGGLNPGLSEQDFSPALEAPPVTGIIRDADGNPLAGVNVVIKGTKKGVTTDAAGKFSIEANTNDVLIISSIGFNITEVKINSINVPLIVALEKSISPLDEVQIIAYGETSKRFNTGNVSTVKAKDIEKQPVNNPLLALQGRVPGLFIEQATGFAGTGVKVRIQGQNSINYGSDPLYVIDGIPFSSQLLPGGNDVLGNSGVGGSNGNPLNFINPADIESIDVLKDADATSIYGSRAANGAILITTKKGRIGKTRFNLNMQSGRGEVPNKLKLMNSQQYLEMRNEALRNDGKASPVPGPYGDSDINGNYDETSSTDWQEELIGKTSHYSDIQASVSGGSNLTTFLIGAGYHKETTVFPGNLGDTKASLHFNINGSSVDKKFNIQLSGNYLLDNNKLPAIDLTRNAMTIAPSAPALYTSDGSINWAPDASGGSTFYSNPIGFLFNDFQDKTNNLIANAILSYKILQGLEIKTSLGYTNLESKLVNQSRLQSSSPEDLPYAQRYTVFGNNNLRSWIVEPQLIYNKSIGKGVLTALLGGTLQQNNNEGKQLLAGGFSNDLVMDDIMSASSLRSLASLNTKYKYNAFFGRLNYNWQEKYILNLTARKDGSSRFGPESQFHNFGSIGGAWIFSNEKLIRDKLHFLSFGKFRGSYGVTGSDQIPDYRFLSLYDPLSQGIPYQGITAYQPNQLNNPYLQWEATRKLQLGMDLGFFKDRILLTANYYLNKSSNQLSLYLLPETTGFNNITKNQNYEIENSGWEFILTAINLEYKDFKWTNAINLTIPKTLLVDYPDILKSSAASSVIIGQPLSVQRLYHFMGVDPATGVYQFADKNGNPTFTPNDSEDRTVLIDLAPKFYGGYQSSFSFKDFRLDLLFSFVKQLGANYAFGSRTPVAGGFNFGNGNQPESLLSRWQKPGDVTSIQKFTTGSRLNQAYRDVMQSDAAWSDASYIRLKNVSLSWRLPKGWGESLHLENFDLFIQGQNLFTISNYIGLDPETKSSISLPPLRVITVGVKIGL